MGHSPGLANGPKAGQAVTSSWEYIELARGKGPFPGVPYPLYLFDKPVLFEGKYLLFRVDMIPYKERKFGVWGISGL